MTAQFDATTLTIRLDTVTHAIPLTKLLTKTRARLSSDGQKQAVVSLEIAPGVTTVVDTIDGNFNAAPPLSSARFWPTLPP
jgi:hypothetical protein